MKNLFAPFAAAAMLVVVTSVSAQTAEPFLLKPLPNGVFAAIDNEAAKADQAGSNAGFVIGKNAVLVVDTFENPKAAEAMLAAIRQKTNLPVKFVANTHYYLDHVAGNGVMAAAGDNVGSAEDVKAFRDYLVFLREAIAQASGASHDAVVKAVLPQLQAKYGKWAFFEFAKPDIDRTDEELRGSKRMPPATP